MQKHEKNNKKSYPNLPVPSSPPLFKLYKIKRFRLTLFNNSIICSIGMIVTLENLNFLNMKGQITLKERCENKESKYVTYKNNCNEAFISWTLKKDSVSEKFPLLRVKFLLEGGESYEIFEIPRFNYEKWCPLNHIVDNDSVYSDCWCATVDFDINSFNIQNDYVIVNIDTKYDQIFNCI